MENTPQKAQGQGRRKLIEFAMILPFGGAILVGLPLLWPAAGGASDRGVSTSSAMIYLFSAWFVMIVLASWLSWRLRRYQADD